MAQLQSATRPEMPTLKRAGFLVRGEIFGVENQPRVSGDRLTELFFPERLRLKRAQKSASDDAKRLFKKPFFTAQLRYYGIKFPSNAAVGDLESMLQEAVLAKKCQGVPAPVIELERTMRKDYEPAFLAWKQEAAKWDAEQRKAQDALWDRCSTPGEQATLDLKRFLRHYFLTDDGKPDPSKTKEPMALPGFESRSALHAEAERIPGLHTQSGGESGARTICIGWDRSAVWSRAAEIDAGSRRQKEAEMKSRWDDAMAQHRALVNAAKKNGRAPKVNAKSWTSDALKACIGSYVVRCKKLTDDYGSDELLTLDVDLGPQEDVLEAAVNFSVFEGTMLLALSEEVLDNFVRDADAQTPAWDDSQDEQDEEDDTKQPKKDAKSKKRQAAATKRKPGRPSKKVKASAPGRRVYIRFRGRETGEGEILPDPMDGHLDFKDDTCTAFKGTVDLPYVGNGAQIEGFKVDSRAQSVAEPWENFSEEAYEEARVGRWH